MAKWILNRIRMSHNLIVETNTLNVFDCFLPVFTPNYAFIYSRKLLWILQSTQFYEFGKNNFVVILELQTWLAAPACFATPKNRGTSPFSSKFLIQKFKSTSLGSSNNAASLVQLANSSSWIYLDFCSIFIHLQTGFTDMDWIRFGPNRIRIGYEF